MSKSKGALSKDIPGYSLFKAPLPYDPWFPVIEITDLFEIYNAKSIACYDLFKFSCFCCVRSGNALTCRSDGIIFRRAEIMIRKQLHSCHACFLPQKIAHYSYIVFIVVDVCNERYTNNCVRIRLRYQHDVIQNPAVANSGQPLMRLSVICLMSINTQSSFAKMSFTGSHE